MEVSLQYWESVLKTKPHKRSDFWSEFRCDNINLGFLKMKGFEVQKDQSNSVPVFEIPEAEFDSTISRIKLLNTRIILDINHHPDKMSYIFADPFGHEFEVTKFRD